MRLVTFNILHGRSPDDGLVDLDRLAAAVRTLDPDILALQEVDRDQPRSHLADLTAIAAEAMGAVSHRFAPALAGLPGATRLASGTAAVPGIAAYGVSLLSRYPVRSWETQLLPRVRFRVPVYRRDARRLIVSNEEPRALLVGHLDTPDGPLVVANTHLSFVPGIGQYQLGQIRRDLAALAGPLVLMGDLNMSGRTPVIVTGYRSLARHTTFPADVPTRQIDHILSRGRIGRVTRTDTLRLPLSDHRALVVDLDLAPHPIREATP